MRGSGDGAIGCDGGAVALADLSFMQTNVRERSLKPGLVLTMLLIVYIMNFLDRQLLGILAGPIKADLQLSDTQFGAIGGLAFA